MVFETEGGFGFALVADLSHRYVIFLFSLDVDDNLVGQLTMVDLTTPCWFSLSANAFASAIAAGLIVLCNKYYILTNGVDQN